MPTYQYACRACDHRFEAVQKFTDASLTECPECSGELRKLYGSVGVVFKGSGFYRNDSRNTGKSATTTKADASASTSSDSAAKKSEPSTTAATKSDSSSSTSSSPSTGSSSSGSSTSTSTAKAS